MKNKAPTADGAVPLPPRERILAVARGLFYRHGVHTVGIDRIIAESGVAKMTFYRHFPSKTNLVAEYLAAAEADWRAHIACHLENKTVPALERLLGLFDALHDTTRCPAYRGCPFIKSLAEFGPENDQPEIRRNVRQHFENLEKDIAGLLKEIRPKDSADFVDPILSLFLGTLVFVQAGGRKDLAVRNQGMIRQLLTECPLGSKKPARKTR